MNREIKFRVWNDDLKLMADWEDVRTMPICEVFGVGHLVPELWTGLKDKDGKEIYEGDIVHCWNEYDKGQRISDYGIWEVYWRIDRWHLRRGEECWDNGDYYQGDDVYWNEDSGASKMEVIGNIHEPTSGGVWSGPFHQGENILPGPPTKD